MSLQDFLGKSSEVLIIDFLIENIGFSYTISEINEFTGLSRTTIHAKIPELIINNILVVGGEAGHVKAYTLADNKLVKKLIETAYMHSYLQAKEPLEAEEAIELIKKKIDAHPDYRENRYYKPVDESRHVSVVPIDVENLKNEKVVTAHNAQSA